MWRIWGIFASKIFCGSRNSFQVAKFSHPKKKKKKAGGGRFSKGWVLTKKKNNIFLTITKK